MVRVELTPHLARFFPGLSVEDVPARTVADVVRELDRRHPGLAGYLVDETGALRKHVNVFVGRRMVADRVELSDPVGEEGVYVFQALSGG